VGRTRPAGAAAGANSLYRRWDVLWDKLLAACRPGAAADGLLAAYRAAGEPPPPMPVARGLGMGFDPPVVSQHLPQSAADERLEPGMVLAVTGYVWERGVGAVFGREAVLIGADGPEVLTSSPWG
jgi:Xaa-Pro aminopeptidase